MCELLKGGPVFQRVCFIINISGTHVRPLPVELTSLQQHLSISFHRGTEIPSAGMEWWSLSLTDSRSPTLVPRCLPFPRVQHRVRNTPGSFTQTQYDIEIPSDPSPPAGCFSPARPRGINYPHFHSLAQRALGVPI